MIDWFSFEVELFLQGKAEQNQFSQVKLQNEQVMGKNENHLKANFLANRNYQAANPDLVEEIRKNYTLKLRGKFLFEMVFKIIAESPETNFHSENLWRICFAQSQINSQNQETYLAKIKIIIQEALS